MTDRSIRASDAERDGVVDILRDAYADGRLTLDEFEQRVSAAYAAKTWADLRELTADLPVQPALGANLPRVPGPAPARERASRTAPLGGPGESSRDRPFGRLLPVMIAWILIAAAAGSPDAVVALVVVFGCLLACRVGYGRRG